MLLLVAEVEIQNGNFLWEFCLFFSRRLCTFRLTKAPKNRDSLNYPPVHTLWLEATRGSLVISCMWRVDLTSRPFREAKLWKKQGSLSSLHNAGDGVYSASTPKTLGILSSWLAYKLAHSRLTVTRCHFEQGTAGGMPQADSSWDQQETLVLKENPC